MITDIKWARSPLVAKLSHFMPLSAGDVSALDAMCVNDERFEADTDLVLEGDVPRSAFVLTQGMAFRYRLMPDGKRQILTFMIPGDIFGLQAFLLTAVDHSIATLMPTRIATIPRDTVFDLFDNHTRELVPHCRGARCSRVRLSANASWRSGGEPHEGASPTCCAS